MVLVDMIGDRDLHIKRDLNSTPWLNAAIWTAATRQSLQNVFGAETTAIEDDHLPFVEAGVPSVDIIDLDYDAWRRSVASLPLSACSASAYGGSFVGSA